MLPIKSRLDLKDRIQLIEQLETNQYSVLKNNLVRSLENLTPINIIKKTIDKILTTPDIKATVINTAILFTIRFFVKRIFTKTKNHTLKKIIGVGIEFLLANIITKNLAKIETIENKTSSYLSY